VTLQTARELIASIALEWIGTPFFPHQAIKQVGADCVHLGLVVYQEAGIMPVETCLPTYNLAGGSHLKRSIVLKWLGDCPFVEPDDAPNLGDVITLQVGRVDHHVGIMVAENQFVHSIRTLGVIKSDLRDTTWKKRLRTFWKPKV
jgi:cell wall-associated NlpC family hydrolase